MPKDHYVAQTYLRNFRNGNNKLWVYSKEIFEIEEKSTSEVCYEEGGSDNPYFKNQRIVENYLKKFERRWPEAISIFTAKEQVHFNKYLNAKLIISGYVSYLTFSTPEKIRRGKIMLEDFNMFILKHMISWGLIPSPPHGLSVDDIKSEVDPKFSQAQGFQSLTSTFKNLYRSPWNVIENETEKSFLTSDNPVCHWFKSAFRIPITYVPLTPKISILIKPVPDNHKSEVHDHTRDSSSLAKLSFVEEINRLVIRSANKIVLSIINSSETLEEMRRM